MQVWQREHRQYRKYQGTAGTLCHPQHNGRMRILWQAKNDNGGIRLMDYQALVDSLKVGILVYIAITLTYISQKLGMFDI